MPHDPPQMRSAAGLGTRRRITKFVWRRTYRRPAGGPRRCLSTLSISNPEQFPGFTSVVVVAFAVGAGTRLSVGSDTGRMGRSGRAITLLGPADLPKWNKIERGLGRKLPRMTLDGKPVATPPQTNGTRRRRQTSGWRPRRTGQAQHTAPSPTPAQRSRYQARRRLRA